MEDVKESLDALLAEYGNLTVKELLTSTTNVVLPQMVQARAILVLKSRIDLRQYAAVRARVPKGAGKTMDIQIMTQPDYDDWTEGSALTAADPSLSKVTVTIGSFGKVTKISDLLQNTSAINFVEEIGRLHGGCVAQGILDKCVDALAGATGNAVTVGTAGDGTEANFDFSHIASAIGEIVADGYTPDILITAPDKFWTAVTTDYDKKLFYGALADFVVSGKAPQVMGLKTLLDPYFEKAINAGSAWDGTNGEKYAIIADSNFAFVWAEMQADPVVELYRDPRELSSYIVTHLDGGAAKGVDNSICLIKHAA